MKFKLYDLKSSDQQSDYSLSKVKCKLYNLTISPDKGARIPSLCNDAPMHSESEGSSSKSEGKQVDYSSPGLKRKSYNLTISPNKQKRATSTCNDVSMHSECEESSSKFVDQSPDYCSFGVKHDLAISPDKVKRRPSIQ